MGGKTVQVVIDMKPKAICQPSALQTLGPAKAQGGGIVRTIEEVGACSKISYRPAWAAAKVIGAYQRRSRSSHINREKFTSFDEISWDEASTK